MGSDDIAVTAPAHGPAPTGSSLIGLEWRDDSPQATRQAVDQAVDQVVDEMVDQVVDEMVVAAR
jgi:hypothetical protein